MDILRIIMHLQEGERQKACIWKLRSCNVRKNVG